MKISEAEIQQRLKYVDFGLEDKQRVLSMAPLVAGQVDAFVAVFFDYLRDFPEAKGLMERPPVLAEARGLKREHLLAMVRGEYGRAYVEERLRLGRVYAEADLDPKVFLGAFHHLMRSIGFKLMEKSKDPVLSFETFMSFKKLAFFDISLIVDTLIGERERVIHLQQQSIRELSTPVLQTKDKVLLLPIVGLVDTERARQMTDNLLQAVRRSRAQVVVIDITGVPVVDSKVADHLTKAVEAARLMGATTIITGLSAALAQTLVKLGVDVGNFKTVGDLRGGLVAADCLLAEKAACL